MRSECDCGARIVVMTHIDMQDGKDTFIYRCGVCGTELEIQVQADTKRL